MKGAMIVAHGAGHACPACRGPMDGEVCRGCGRDYPAVAGLPDLRLESDRYLGLSAERAKAERLASIAATTTLEGVARAYYAITPDVDPPRCARYLAHILGAEARGDALAERLTDDGPILEVGCGTGGLLVAAARRGLTIEGVDIAARWLVVARRRLDDHGLSVPLTAASAERLPWRDASFATVVADSVIEHCDDPGAALREWRRVLRPGGRLLVWSPNRFAPVVDPHVRLWGLGFLPRRWAEAYVRLRRGGAWIPGTLSAAGAARMAREAGFEGVKVGPPPISRRWALGRPARQRSAMLLHERLRGFGPSRALLGAFGPLWELEARAPRGLRGVRRVDPPCSEGSRRSDTERPGMIRPIGRVGLAACLGAEVVAGALGFLATVHLARRLGPGGFATVEVALAASAWMLVLVRGGLDQVVIREAARRPRLIGRLTGLLLSLRLAWAAIGVALLGLIAAAGGGRPEVLMASGLVLLTSALVADIGPRARNELAMLAGLQVFRALGMAGFLVAMVAGPGDLVLAAVAPGVAEAVIALVCAVRSIRADGWPRPRWRDRAARVFSGRAAVAGLTRFGRVGLYLADAMALGLAIEAGGDRGAYAAGRRLVFALVAVGMVVPTLLAPALARARLKGPSAASDEVGRGVSLLLGLFVPAALGLMMTSGRILPFLFGDDYRSPPVLLMLIAMRLPVLLAATWLVTALVAIGREREALKVTASAGVVAAVVTPLSAISFGTVGLGAAALGVEVVAAAGGWLTLRRLGIEPGRASVWGRLVAGSLGLVGAVAISSAAPVVMSCLAGAIGYAAGWMLAGPLAAGRPRMGVDPR